MDLHAASIEMITFQRNGMKMYEIWHMIGEFSLIFAVLYGEYIDNDWTIHIELDTTGGFTMSDWIRRRMCIPLSD